MGNRKPRSKSDRIPITSAGPRKTMLIDPVPNREGTLAIPKLAAEEREARNEAAVRYLTRRGATDLLDVLGLAEPAKRQGFGPLSVPCPQCQEPAGSPCVGEAGGTYLRGHRGRARRAQELREAAP